MEKISTIKALYFIGLCLISVSQICFHYYEFSDFANGVLNGGGFGFLLLPLIFRGSAVAKNFHRCFFLLFIHLTDAPLIYSQSTIDLSSNSIGKSIPIKGTILYIDTTGINLPPTDNPRVFANIEESTVLSVEQKQIGITEYEEFMKTTLQLDQIENEYNVKFEEFTGKLKIAKVKLQNENKYFWLCYLGNSEMVVEIKAFYNETLHSKYNSSFDRVVKSIFIDSKKEISIFEDLPFYLDETKFPYEKQMSFMPQSITISRVVDGENRMVSLTFFESSEEEMAEIKQNYTKDSIITLNDREILYSIQKDEDRISYSGLVAHGNKTIQFNCFYSHQDVTAIDEFKEMVHSLVFR